MIIPEIKQERLYQKIANIIIQLINDKIFPSGSFLPPERELAKQLGVSRASLREALIVLEISGWIIIQSGNGVIVADRSAQRNNDYTIEEILYSRELVDSHCARLAAQHNDPLVISQIKAIYHSMEQAIEKNNVHEFYSLDKKFHLALSSASGNRVLHEMSSMLWDLRVNIPYAGLEKRSSDKLVLTELNKQHKAIVDAIEQSDADEASRSALNHLSFVKELVGELTA